jgi:hypothetical protein
MWDMKSVCPFLSVGENTTVTNKQTTYAKWFTVEKIEEKLENSFEIRASKNFVCTCRLLRYPP